MKELKIICDYVLKELDNIEELHNVTVIMNKVLKSAIHKLVDD